MSSHHQKLASATAGEQRPVKNAHQAGSGWSCGAHRGIGNQTWNGGRVSPKDSQQEKFKTCLFCLPSSKTAVHLSVSQMLFGRQIGNQSGGKVHFFCKFVVWVNFSLISFWQHKKLRIVFFFDTINKIS